MCGVTRPLPALDRERTTIPGDGSDPAVALIMRSKNEQPYASHTLACLGTQTFRNFTLYNCDSGSTDGTLEAIGSYNPEPENIQRIEPQDYVPGPVLNMMIARTRQPIIVLLNADAVPTNDEWLEKLLLPLIRGEADATFSRQRARSEARFVVAYDYQRAYDPANVRKAKVPFFSAVACAFKRDIWEKIHFPEEGYAEDVAWAALVHRIGGVIVLAEGSEVEHSHSFTLKQLYRKHHRHGITFVRMHPEHPRLWRHAYRLGVEVLRDAFFSLRHGRVDVLPYNIAYRSAIQLAYYRGKKQAARDFRKGLKL